MSVRNETLGIMYWDTGAILLIRNVQRRMLLKLIISFSTHGPQDTPGLWLVVLCYCFLLRYTSL